MIQLPTEFRKNGYDYRQVHRGEEVVIYDQLSEGKHIAYEVCEIIKAPQTELFGRIIPAREILPGSEKWGVNAFTVWSLEKAFEKAGEIQGLIESRKINLSHTPKPQI